MQGVCDCVVCGKKARHRSTEVNGQTVHWIECCGEMRHRTEERASQGRAVLDWMHKMQMARLMEVGK